MLVQSTLRCRLRGYSSQGSRDSPVYSPLGSQDSLVYSPPGSWDSPVYSSSGSHFGHRGVISLILRSIQQSLKGLSFYKSSVGYFNSLGKCDLNLQKLPNIKDSNRLPGVFIAGESIMNTNNFTNIRKNLKSVLDMPNGTSRRCLMKKTEHKKFRDTVPLTDCPRISLYPFSLWSVRFFFVFSHNFISYIFFALKQK